MGNNQSNISDSNTGPDIKTDIKPAIKTKSILKKPVNIQNKEQSEKEQVYYDEPKDYHKKNKIDVDNRINEHQYFQQDPLVNYDFNNQVGIESKNDTRFQTNINNMYEHELNNRDLNTKNGHNAKQIYENKLRTQIGAHMKNINNSQNNSTIVYDAYAQPQMQYPSQQQMQYPSQQQMKYPSQQQMQYPSQQQMQYPPKQQMQYPSQQQMQYPSQQQMQYPPQQQMQYPPQQQMQYPPQQQQMQYPPQQQQMQYQNENTISREKALEIKNIKKFTNLDKRLMIMNNIELGNIDPFNLIKNTPRLTLDELKMKYMSLRNIHHPDKGGNKEMFILVNSSLKNINYIISSRLVDKDFNELKHGYSKYHSNEKKKNPVGSDGSNLLEKIGKNFSNEKFNVYFEENKFSDDINYEGYANIMTDGGIREDIEIEKTINKFEKNTFNNVFEKNKNKTSDKIIKYIEPVAVNDDTNYKQLGTDNDNFSGRGNKLEYLDYKDAFTIYNTLNVPEYKCREQTVEDIEKERENDDLLMSNEQVDTIEKNKQSRDIKEKKRRSNLDEFDHNLGIHYEKIHKSMISF